MCLRRDWFKLSLCLKCYVLQKVTLSFTSLHSGRFPDARAQKKRVTKRTKQQDVQSALFSIS